MSLPWRLAGTATRGEALGWAAVWMVAGVLALAALDHRSGAVRLGALAAVALAQTAFLAVLVRRFHAMGRSGLWVLLASIPLLGLPVIAWALLAPARQVAFSGGRYAPRPAYALGLAAILLAGAFVISRAFWVPYVIVAGSMKPTLLPGDYAIALKVDPATLTRGDVVAYRHPVDGGVYTARLIGLPGDTIAVTSGVLTIDGSPVALAPAPDFIELKAPQGPQGAVPACANEPVGIGAACIKGQMTETLPGGPAHPILDIRAGVGDEMAPLTVPPAHVFVMGDNRDNALDSRFLRNYGGPGPVPLGNVTARLRWVAFSAAGRSAFAIWTWRGDRFLKAIR